MIPQNFQEDNSEQFDYEKFQRLQRLLIHISDELAELKTFYYLIHASWNIDDTVDVDSEHYISETEQFYRMHLFVGTFISRFTPKDMRQLADAAHEAHILFKQFPEHR